MKPKIILIAGFYRSGSTWQYNAVRLLFESSGESVYACYIDDCNPECQLAKESMTHIIKIHNYEQWLFNQADVVLITYRDIESITYSMKRIGMNRIINNLIIYFSVWQRNIFPLAHYTTFYRNIKDEAFVELCRLSEVVDCERDHDQLIEIRNKLDNLKEPAGESFDSCYDPVTLLHPKHISR